MMLMLWVSDEIEEVVVVREKEQPANEKNENESNFSARKSSLVQIEPQA